ncbi:arsenate-mycothiol transferase [Tersicoccus sp. Bi-70]|nr:arsenate-mycothiol transferase [Tersicoccus sp. Bi-70]
MAAALARRDAGEALEIHSAGVRPGSELNDLSRRSLEEAGASVAGEYPKPLDAALLRRADRVVVLGREAVVEPVEGMRGTIVTWDTDEPSTRGIEGIERMRLVRDDIARRVDALVSELVPRD